MRFLFVYRQYLPILRENFKIVVDGFINTVINKTTVRSRTEFMHPNYVKHHHDGKPDANAETFLKEHQGLVSQYPNIKSHIKKSITSGDEVWLWTYYRGVAGGV